MNIVPLLTVASALCGPAEPDKLPMRWAVAIADKVIDDFGAEPVLWDAVRRKKLEELPESYARHDLKHVEQYKELSQAIQNSPGFQSELAMALTVQKMTIDAENRVIIEGRYRARDIKSGLFLTKREASRARAIHVRNVARNRYNFRPSRRLMSRRSEARVVERKAYADSIYVVVVVEADQARAIDWSRVVSANRVKVRIRATAFHVRAPMTRFNVPAAIGSVVGALTFVDPVFVLDDPSATPPRSAPPMRLENASPTPRAHPPVSVPRTRYPSKEPTS